MSHTAPAVNFEQLASETPAATEDQLTRLARLAQRQLELENELAIRDDELKRTAAELRQVSEVDIPAILDETGLSEIRLADGTKVVLKEDLRVSTTGRHRGPINAWLAENGHGDIIRDEVKVAFPADGGAAAAALVKYVEGELHSQAERNRFVNPQTFAALLRELRDNGVDVPLGDLGAFVQRRAKLERPK